jgi:hypothetical protein
VIAPLNHSSQRGAAVAEIATMPSTKDGWWN